MTKKYTLDGFGYEVEIGKVARQAGGAVWFTIGDTVILATATESESKNFPGFLPLTVDYREHTSAAGKVPGGYFKREGRSSDHEILTSRLIDRAIRPLFPKNYFDQVQVLTTVYSVDKEFMPSSVALTVASLALSISEIPFHDPIASIEIARINGELIINPSYSQTKESDVRLVVAGNKNGLCMVEGSMDQMTEQELIDAFFIAHDSIKKIIEWQEKIKNEIGKQKREVEDVYHWDYWSDKVEQYLNDQHIKSLYIEDKTERNAYLRNIRDIFFTQFTQELEEKATPETVIKYIFDQTLKPKIVDRMLQTKQRVDGRSFEQVRTITSEVSVLPSVHGSSLFTRGSTQALASATLGGGQDAQRYELLMEKEEQHKIFMLHYNFPPFSVGEVGFLRAPGRREIGHGYLAASSFKYLLPEKDVFPYTIRLVVDVLESNGSSSMATACASTLALMDAGVPIKKMISGVAMGLLINDQEDYAVLSDITGFEDGFGLMDFKVVGTNEGITAIQMDIKYRQGLSREIMQQALMQAKKSRLHIMDEMQKTLTEPKKLSQLVPKVETLKIHTDKIGAVIGSGGKVIREITETTGVKIDIEEDGLVKIFAGPEDNLDLALSWVKTLAGQIEVGQKFSGQIRKIADFGMFVALVPGVDGLMHVSNIPADEKKIYAQKYKVGDVVDVTVVNYDSSTGRIGLRMEKEKK
jgi:polyribonucleotide nucleotidyltransferase